ncbi:hypothetical protein ACT8ZV_21010 [Nocardioides sp. MAHUQ-72]|uniref:hypothetical protein n=1 Tax=unclassified Nocardioides TaxID=2615069 RepID=UPI003612791D
MDRFRLASLLAVLAVVAVLGTAVTAVAAYTQRDGSTPSSGGGGTPGPGEPSASRTVEKVHVFDDGQFVVGDRGDNALFEVPASAEGWSLESSDTVVYYLDRQGDPAVGVNGPAVFRDGYCKKRSTSSNRGFVGFTRSATGMGARQANTDLAKEWVAAISLNEDLRTSSPHTPVRTTQVTLADGSTAVRSTSRITLSDPGPCDPPAVQLAIVSLDTGEAVANLVMVRDLDAPGTLDDDLAEKILSTLRRAVA